MITFASASEASTPILSKPIKMYNKHKLRNKPSQCARCARSPQKQTTPNNYNVLAALANPRRGYGGT